MTDRGGLNELALFAGVGGGLLGSHLLGWRTLCAVELDPSAAAVLIRRQNDGILPPFPIWDDVRTFDGKPWRGLIDEVSGGFPCTDIAICGSGAGLDGEASGLWLEMRRIIAEVRPRYAFVENSAMLTSRRLGRVLGDVAEMGSMHDGECSVHMTPGWVTDVNGSGLWPTPTASDEKGSVTPETAMKRAANSSRGIRLPEYLTLKGLLPGGRHNPEFSEWLMAWPLRWTDIGALGTVKFQQWSELHGICWPATTTNPANNNREQHRDLPHE